MYWLENVQTSAWIIQPSANESVKTSSIPLSDWLYVVSSFCLVLFDTTEQLSSLCSGKSVFWISVITYLLKNYRFKNQLKQLDKFGALHHIHFAMVLKTFLFFFLHFEPIADENYFFIYTRKNDLQFLVTILSALVSFW